MKLLPYPHVNQLCEAMQVNDVKFAFTNKTDSGDYQVLMNFVKCREYFNEFLMKNHHPDEFKFVETYGFQYKYEEYPYNMKNPSIAIKLPKKAMYKVFSENLHFLNMIEDFNGIEKSRIVEIEDDSTIGKTFILEYSPTWINTCLLFNIYTLLIKLCTLNIQNKTYAELKEKYKLETPSELTYINSITIKKVNNLLNNLKDMFKFPSKYVDGFNMIRGSYDIHGKSGLLAFTSSYYYMNDAKDSVKMVIDCCNTPATVEFIKE